SQGQSLFFFQAEDGIRYWSVTGVQTCALPIFFQTEREEAQNCQFATTPNDSTNMDATTALDATTDMEKFALFMRLLAPPTPSTRSEERRVGKECRSRG